MRSLPWAPDLPAARCGALFFSFVSQQMCAHTIIIIIIIIIIIPPRPPIAEEAVASIKEAVAESFPGPSKLNGAATSSRSRRSG